MAGVVLGKDIVTGDQGAVNLSSGNFHVAQYVWDTDTLSWVKQTKSTGATGSDVNVTNFPSVYPVTDNGGSLTVDGVFWQAVQPVSWTGQSVSITGTVPVSLASTTVTNTVAVSGTVSTGLSQPLTDTQLRATAVPVSLASTTVTNTVAVSGTVSTGLSQPLTDTQLRATAVPVSLASTTVTGTVATREATNATSAITSVTASVTTVTLKALNASRRGLSVYNNSTADLYLKLGATASTTSFTVKVLAGGYYEVPFNYTGVVDGIWSAANGSALVTEIT